MKSVVYTILISLTISVFLAGLFFWKYQGPIVEYFKDDYFTDKKVLALCNAGHDGNIKKIDELLAEGADINHRGKDGVTPLYWVLISKRKTKKTKEGFNHLVEKGADPTIIVSKGRRAVINFAAMYKDSDYLKIILEHGVDDIDLDKVPDARETPLLSAKSSDRFENFVRLLDYGADIEHKEEFGYTPLTESTGNGTWKFAYELLKRGADYTVNTGKGREEPNINASMKNLRYWPSVATSYHGTDYRQKCVEFLREKGVEVNPWMPEDEKYVTENGEDILYIQENSQWIKYTDSKKYK